MPLSNSEAKDTMRLGEADEGRLWLPLNALRAFEAVGDHLSFTGAAAALHIAQSALSRHVSRLEEHLGCRLLERRSQGLMLTAAGSALLPVLRRSFDEIEGALTALRREPGRGRRVLKVHMPPTFLAVAGLSMLAEFRRTFPDVPIDVSSSNGIGLPAGRNVDLAVVFDRPHVGDVIRDPLWMVGQTPACAPEIAAARDGRDLQAFLRDNELLHVKLEGESFGSLWSHYAEVRSIDIGVSRGLAFETESLAVQCAAAGGGVTLVDVDMFAREIAEGRLVTPFPDASLPSGYGYYLAVHPEDMVDPAISLFRSWVIRHYAQGAANALAGSPGPGHPSGRRTRCDDKPQIADLRSRGTGPGARADACQMAERDGHRR